MSRTRVSLGLGTLVLAAGAAALIAAQPEGKPGEGAAPKDDPGAAMMAAYEAAGKPGVQHELLKQFVGTWDAKISMFMPGAPEPMVSTGVMVNTMVHAGRYLHSAYTGEFGGQTFTGTSYWAYSNMSKRWEGTWVDSMSTGIYYSTGTLDGKKGEWTMTGEYDHPMGYRCKQREVFTMPSKDTYTMTTYSTDKDQKEAKAMEIVYTRRAESGGK